MSWGNFPRVINLNNPLIKIIRNFRIYLALCYVICNGILIDTPEVESTFILIRWQIAMIKWLNFPTIETFAT